MRPGDGARAGRPDAVRAIAADLSGRRLGDDAGTRLSGATERLGEQAGRGVSVDRILALVQAVSAPTRLVQLTDHGWGAALERYGSRLAHLARAAGLADRNLAEARGAGAPGRPRSEARIAGAVAVASALGAEAAGEAAAAALGRLRELDGERTDADADAARAIDDRRREYAAIRAALPRAPRSSAGATAVVAMPDGSRLRLTAARLAALRDPASVAAAWDRLDAAQRARLAADAPGLIGNLEGIPLRDRDRANRSTARAYREELVRQLGVFDLVESRPGAEGLLAQERSRLREEIRSLDAILGDRAGVDAYTVYDERGRAVPRAGVVLVAFHPLRDSVVTFHGALDPVTGGVPPWMRHVGVLVPGTNSGLARFTADLDRGQDLLAASGGRAGFFVWRGAPAPEFAPPGHVLDPARPEYAEVAGPRLAAFVNGLRLPPGASVVPIGHSHGAAVLGAAEARGLDADRVVYVAPAGLGHGSRGLSDFPRTADRPHFVLQARNDAVVGWNQGLDLPGWLGLGHGSVHPLRAPGVIRLETGELVDGDPSSGAVERVGGVAAHSAVFTPGSTSLRNIAAVVTGEPVTLFRPDPRPAPLARAAPLRCPSSTDLTGTGG